MKIFYRAFCVILCVLAVSVTFAVQANDTGASCQDNLAQKGYSIRFAFSVADQKGASLLDAKGVLLVCGTKLRIDIPEQFLIVSDGVDQWVYNRSNEEIVVSKSEISSLISPQMSPVEAMERVFGFDLAADKGADKGEKDKYVVKKDKEGNPVEVVMNLDKMTCRVKMEKPVYKNNIPQEMFSFDAKSFPEAFVTDMR